jgi:hypothetical protein
LATVPSLRVVKSFSFKDGLRQWSNRYHFTGGTPADDTHWHTLMDAVVTAEKAVLGASNTIVTVWGYAAGSDVPVSSKTYTTVGTYAPGTGGQLCPGEACGLIRWSTAARSTKNHPIYCFNYYHGTFSDSAVDQDKVKANLKTAMQTYATAWVTGFSDGGPVTAKRSTPQGATSTGSLVEEFITHRDFPSSTSV